MRALRSDLQGFAQAIVHGDSLLSGIDPSYPHYSASDAIDIYRNNYQGNLHDALAGAYPVIEQLVGSEFFRMLARRFIGQYPSQSGNLHLYGEEMAQFVSNFEPARTLAYLADIATLEWACHRSYFSADADQLDLAALSLIPSEHYACLVLLSYPGCTVVRSRYPIAAIWQAHQTVAPIDFRIRLDEGPCFALVSRKDDVVYVSELSEADATWLDLIRAGNTLGDATAQALASWPDFDLPVCLSRLASLGTFSGFNVKGLT